MPHFSRAWKRDLTISDRSVDDSLGLGPSSFHLLHTSYTLHDSLEFILFPSL